ncbi:hypothetical protein AGMMS49983_21210 [Clostridia bacterium]|nr:hypothetical protein AGMMS49983_21210 [Clostridia bacterium]
MHKRKIQGGQPLEIFLPDMPPEDRAVFPSGIQMLLLVPILLREVFWGFIVVSASGTTQFGNEELAVLNTAGTLIVSSILERQLTEGLIEAREEAFSASRAKSEFLSNMSHEMRTPMNAILGMTAIGKSSGDIGQKDEAFEKIQGASKHLLGIINDILDISKIETGKLELSIRPFDFWKMLQNVTSAIDFSVKEKEQRFLIEFDERIPARVIGDEQRLAQVIMNLLSNAVKFTPKQGELRLSVALHRATNGSCSIHVSVKDTGIGISPEQQKKLFESFQQAESGASRKFSGTGLGLAIAKNIVETMGGEIWIESQLGKGSAFTFVVPLELEAAENETEEDVIPNLEGRWILLAEDVEINAEIVLALLEPTGLEVDWVMNGVEAVRRYTENPEKYELIFMDLQMPEMGGLEAARRIRTSGESGASEIPIVAMTANVYREDVANCIAAGMNDHISKPVDFSEVLKALRKYLG